MPDLKQMIQDAISSVEKKIEARICRKIAAALSAYADSLQAQTADDSAKKPPEPPDR
jgi:hypothetical protein